MTGYLAAFRASCTLNGAFCKAPLAGAVPSRHLAKGKLTPALAGPRDASRC